MAKQSELAKLNRKRNKLIKEREPFRLKVLELSKNEIVKEYIEAENKSIKLFDEIDKLESSIIREQQKNCKHHIFYLQEYTYDDHEGRSYYKCKCLECEKEIEGRVREFENVVKYSSETRCKASFYEVQKEYNILMKKHKNDIKKVYEILTITFGEKE